MGALERYDKWEAGLDGLALEELYDPVTLHAFETRIEPASAGPARWRANLAAGALAAGIARGVGDPLSGADDDALFEVEAAQPRLRLEPVSVHLVWGEPAAGVAVVRPWLFAGRQADCDG